MLLSRLVRWERNWNLFHSLHFGFLPFQDSTNSLCTFFCDIERARAFRFFTVADYLDIKAAYDSVWNDSLIYKLSCSGVTGCMGYWLAQFLGSRNIQVR